MRSFLVLGAVPLMLAGAPGPAATLHAAERSGPARPAARHAAPVLASKAPCQGVLLLPGAPMALAPTVAPRSVVGGDWNGDGKTDLATANSGIPQVTIRLSQGDGTFKPEVALPIPGGASALARGDWNGDGKPDIASANSEDATVSLLLNRGDGTFRAAVTYPVGYKPVDLGSGDLNGDGKLDLVTIADTKKGNDLSVLLGKGDGTFQRARSFNLSASAIGLTVGDFDGDGKLDVVTASQGARLSLVGRQAVRDSGSYAVNLLRGKGDGTFQPARPFPLGSEPRKITSGDVNGDGKRDVILGSWATGVGVLLGNGDGTFQPARAALRATITALATGDWNGDGKLDVAFLEPNAPLKVLIGQGDGGFKPPVAYPVGEDPVGIASGDWDGDGKADLAVTALRDISIFLGKGDGTFPAARSDALPHGGHATIAADLDGDGRPELVTIDEGSEPNVAVLRLADDGPREAGTYTVVPGGTGLARGLKAVAAGDWNGDGRIDLAVSGSLLTGAALLFGNGDGTFKPPVTVGDDKSYWAVLGADVNGDGKLDLVMTVQRGESVSVLLGKGDGTFRPALPSAAGRSAMQLVAGDWDRDGKLDLATLTAEGVAVLVGKGDGTFKLPVPYAAGPDLDALASGDFDGDGKVDLVATSKTMTRQGAAALLLGKGDGTFRPVTHHGAGHSGGDQAVSADLDGDGKLDLVLANGGFHLLTWLRGKGDGTFHEPRDYPVASLPKGLIVTDRDQDGRLDVVLVHSYPRAVTQLLQRCR